MRRTAAALAVMAAALTACSSTPPPLAAPPSATSSAATTATTATTASSAAPSRSPRGLLVKAKGQTAGFSDQQSGAQQADFTLDAIEVDPPCTSQFTEKPEHGHRVVLTFTVKTTPQYRADQGWMITGHDFAIVGPDGVTETALVTGAAFMCLDQKEWLPTNPFAPASTYRGKLPLDTRNSGGVITYRPPTVNPSGGWEWQF
ncbi:hypothetical protein PV646_34155 [Streptomyces sp. ID05-26A]|nr:hypothetical protein [Streptomyces sp. ID05-26A]